MIKFSFALTSVGIMFFVNQKETCLGSIRGYFTFFYWFYC